MADKRGFNWLGYRTVLAGGFQTTGGGGFYSGSAFPKSGTAGTTVHGTKGAPVGSTYLDTSSNVLFVNEGTATSPYWSPVSFKQRGLWGMGTDFTDGFTGALVDTTYVINTLGLPLAVTETTANLSNGLRIHGQGLDELDAGLTVAAVSDQGAVATLTCTNEDAHIAVIGFGNGTTPAFKPSVNGTMVIDATVAISSLTASAAFLGFCGSAADALDPIMTYSGTTISFAATIGDNVHGLAYSSELTDNDAWFAVHDKSNANASISTGATGVDISTAVVAGTYQRLRVEIDADGALRVFVDKVLKSSFAAGTAATTTALQPMFYIESSTTATKSATLKHFMTYGKRA